MKPNEDTCRVPTIVDPKKTHSDSDVCVVSDHKVQSTTASPCSKKKPKNPEDRCFLVTAVTRFSC